MTPVNVLTLMGLAIRYGPIILRLVQSATPILEALKEAAPELVDPLRKVAREAYPGLSERNALSRALSELSEPNVTRLINEERGGD